MGTGENAGNGAPSLTEPGAIADLAELADPTEADEIITKALQRAVVPPLLAALALALDDDTLLPEHLRPGKASIMDPNAGLTEPQLAEARELARKALTNLREQAGRDGQGSADHNRPASEQGADSVTGHLEPLEHRAVTTEELHPILEFLAGGEPVVEYLELLQEELGLGEDLRAPQWHKSDLAPDRAFRVAVIGAGMSGLVAAHRLRQAGLDVVVIEKNHDVGGTWLDNTYPGCRVDVNNHFYSYSFAPKPDWPQNFSSQDVLLDYFRAVAADNGLRECIRFGTEVTAIELDDATMTWSLQLSGSEGLEESLEAQAVVSAVGQLNRPHMPDLPGIDSFVGPSFHSARWDHDLDLRGKRVAVLGTGASAAQFIPEIAKTAGQLTVFQRTPPWFLPTPDYTEPVAAEEQWLFRNVPGYANWYRFWIFWQNVEGLMPAAEVDPGWEGGEASVSMVNDGVRQMLAAYLEAEFADRPDLLEQVIPDYPPFAKRFIRDNGAWATALKRDNVELVTDGIAEIVPGGVRSGAGTVHEADVIIYGTGFTASDFLMPMKVVGRGGVDLHERWDGDARAHLGVTLPGYPNFFMLYGPNTNIVVNGSITYFSECEVSYVVGCLQQLLNCGARALEPTPEAHNAFNERVDAENLRMAWGVSSVHSWYKNATGRSAQNWPFSLLEYWRLTRHPDPADYAFW